MQDVLWLKNTGIGAKKFSRGEFFRVRSTFPSFLRIKRTGPESDRLNSRAAVYSHL